ncbi:unnamed protein product [Cladocopium goreaui]|uniref:Protein kinase domain-containing protein n=1 Tax=Cladocopium goreaui TaxID=2562237 RepID=A0A9P1CCU1_9DINO|nr:unnamed protein product [Cladocopium goreaui]
MIITLYSRDANPSMKREVLRVFTLRLVRGLGQSTPAVAGTLPAPKDHVQLEENIDIGRAAALVMANASSDSGNLAGEPRSGMSLSVITSLDVDAEKEIPSCELIATKCIGSGVTSEVYQGHWNRIGRVVAIKMITDRSAFRKDEQLAFAREMKVLTQVQHENLVTFYGVCIDSPPLRIVTEFCEGGACFELLHNSDDVDLIWPQQIKMCKDVAAAMYYLHTFDPMIIHRDLKSLNLLLDRPVYGPTDVPTVKVCDFGVAKLQREGEWGQMTAQAGTKHWMAPEMWRGTRYDEKVDVFSYAMVIYEIVCREVPFEEEEPADVGKYTLAGVRPDMDAVPPDTPPDLIHVILGCRSAGPKNPEIDPVFLLLDPPGVIFVVKHLGKAALKVQAGSRQCPSVDQHRRLDPMIPMIPMPIRESVKLEKSGTVTPCTSVWDQQFFDS